MATVSLFSLPVKKGLVYENTKLEIEDFNKPEAEEYFIPCTIDPGHKQIFTASIDHNSDKRQIRRCSDLEPCCYASVQRRQGYVEELKKLHKIKGLEANIPTSKTMQIGNFDVHLNYVF
ncbi:hypothetical protein INT48_005473 [Thamnidium elegans]|uniref:Uncharacterized protein n=1 Tax=Thamnidium elegans TaxID=101142 RepID=A0A8H7SIQ7_9FUNG|nr:hypothetical protein INT48_005473 [Thamnidium elegans]